jgi:hypothetical protein
VDPAECDLTEESLQNAIIELTKMANQGKISLNPTHIYIPPFEGETEEEYNERFANVCKIMSQFKKNDNNSV